MAKKKKTPEIPSELIDRLLVGRDLRTALDSDGLIGDLRRALAERMRNTEIDLPLAKCADGGVVHYRDGYRENIFSEPERVTELSIPRDRHGRLNPALIRKYCRQFPGFDAKIISLYARGMSVRDIQRRVREIYGVEIFPDLVAVVTDSVLVDVSAWQARQLEPSYAIVFFDDLSVNVLENGVVRHKAVYLAIGVRASGQKDVLGLWIDQGEGHEFWLRLMKELKARGTQDVLIAVGDDLPGFREAMAAVFPDTVVQTCIVHLIRTSTQFGSWNERKSIASALRHIYCAKSAPGAAVALAFFDQDHWGQRYPAIGDTWRRHWEDAVVPFFDLPAEVRRIIYTTNAIETLNAAICKVLRNKEHFPSDEAAMKLMWLALRNVANNWKNAPMWWRAARVELERKFEGRVRVNDRANE